MLEATKRDRTALHTPPEYCEYADGGCDHSFAGLPTRNAVVLYPSEPPQIAATIEAAATQLTNRIRGACATWRSFNVGGQVIFCEICKAMRGADAVVADVTTLNFNLLFEIGFSLGLDLPLVPIRDTSFLKDKSAFDHLGLLDTIGYRDFVNARELADNLASTWPPSRLPIPVGELNLEAPLYVLKGPLETEGELKLLSVLKKSAVRFRAYDPVETPRIALQTLRRSIASSLGLVAHLLSPDRKGALVHNARCALAAGIATASGKAVRLLQEGREPQPIDYRDLVQPYDIPTQIERLIEPTLLRVIHRLQDTRFRDVRSPRNLLQRLDIGDVSAENEIRPLEGYFVETGQYYEARRGYARLIVGRKGAGKTAIFYALRHSLGGGHSRLVLDLKPEGHQFVRLREAVLAKLSPGLQEAALTGFWMSILLGELAHRVVDDEYSWATRDPARRLRYDELVEVYKDFGPAEKGDFSQRLLYQVERLSRQDAQIEKKGAENAVAELLFRKDIRVVRDAVTGYLEEKEEVWLLLDNLDKGWPTRGASSEDIMIIRTLLECTRKLQRQLERSNVEFHVLVFLRNDIYEHLIEETPDKGKDTAVILDWADAAAFKEMFRRRVLASGQLEGEFDSIWGTIFAPAVGTRDSFSYVAERTLMRPRDFLSFVHNAIEVAINRGHDKVLEEDLRQAEEIYSEDSLRMIGFELQDVCPGVPDILYQFLGCPSLLRREEIITRLEGAGVVESETDHILSLMCWLGVLGVYSPIEERTRFAYEIRYDLRRLLAPVTRDGALFGIHPAFRTALECVEA